MSHQDEIFDPRTGNAIHYLPKLPGSGRNVAAVWLRPDQLGAKQACLSRLAVWEGVLCYSHRPEGLSHVQVQFHLC